MKKNTTKVMTIAFPNVLMTGTNTNDIVDADANV